MAHERKGSEGLSKVAESVDRVLDTCGISIMLENAAGQGDSIGTSIPELGDIYRRISQKERVSLCIDTAHIFEAGYNVRSRAVWKRIITEVEEHAGS